MISHFVSGIFKIILLEASVALLFIDRIAPDRFPRAQRWALAFVAGLMVFTWSNFGGLQGAGVSVLYILTIVPLALGLSWLFGAGLSAEPTAWMKKFRARVKKSFHRTVHAPVAIVLAVLLAWGWVWSGHQLHAIPLVHRWEQFHFYLGAKYQREIGWFDLYKAVVIADRETVNVLSNVQTIRDTATFDQVPIGTAFAESDRIHSNFAPERWKEFKEDWMAMVRTWGGNWEQIVNDHGNSNSPAWSIIAYPITRLVPISAENQSYLGWLDMLLMLFLWLFLYETFGRRLACFALIIWAVPENTFGYLAGSFLRWDWLFAVGMAAAFIKRGRWATSGAFFAYAVASKLFPICFGVALALKVLPEVIKKRALDSRYVRFIAGAAVCGVVVVGLSSAMFGFSAWKEYEHRIATAQVEKYYPIQYSLKTVYLQLATLGDTALTEAIFPSEIQQARYDVDIKDHAIGYLVIRLLFTFAVFLLVRRATDVEAFLVGPLLVFTWLTVNMYYWNMLGLLALGLASRRARPTFSMLVGLHLIFMMFYLYQHLSHGFSEAYSVAFVMCFWILGFAAWEWWAGRKGAPAPAALAAG
jgi:hypothetical protein